jgi:hypothetical protein
MKAKATIYDYGVHVPLVVSGPAVVGAPRISNELVSTVDLFGTMAEMARFTTWKNALPAGKINDSRSLMPLLRNQPHTPRTWIFSEQFNNPTIAADGKTIRDSVYHLQRFDNGTEAFFRLSTDSLEDMNLLASPGTMSTTDWQHYYALCDTLSSLTNTLPCWASGTANVSTVHLEIYPNPSNGICNISGLQGTWQLRLIDIAGKVWMNSLWHEGQALSLSPIPQGIYLLEARQGGVRHTTSLQWTGK